MSIDKNIKTMTLTKILELTQIKELKRALNSDKDYLYFEISVYNTGTVINIKCTNIYREINRNKWNGYNFYIVNDNITKYYIEQTLKSKL